VVPDAPSSVKDALSGGVVYLFGRNMETVYVYKGTVRGPTFRDVVFPPVPIASSLTVGAPKTAGFAGDYVFAIALIRRDTKNFVRTDGLPVENSNIFTIR
jgi:hypothetical protein